MCIYIYIRILIGPGHSTWFCLLPISGFDFSILLYGIGILLMVPAVNQNDQFGGPFLDQPIPTAVLSKKNHCKSGELLDATTSREYQPKKTQICLYRHRNIPKSHGNKIKALMHRDNQCWSSSKLETQCSKYFKPPTTSDCYTVVIWPEEVPWSSKNGASLWKRSFRRKKKLVCLLKHILHHLVKLLI